jgi:hypothetical protein
LFPSSLKFLYAYTNQGGVFSRKMPTIDYLLSSLEKVPKHPWWTGVEQMLLEVTGEDSENGSLSDDS